MSLERERKPYNPYHLAGGYAAESLPDRKTIAVFKCYCNHTDFMGGSVSVSLPTVMRETGYSRRAVCYADAVLRSLGRITKKSRGIGGRHGGRRSSITTVHCSEAELRRAGATDENYFGRGGGSGLFKVQTQPVQSAKRVHSKCKQDGFKVQRDALEPLKSEPFLPEPFKTEPKKAKAKTETPCPLPEQVRKEGEAKAAGTPRLPEAKPLEGSAPAACPLKSEVAAKLRAAGCPETVFAALAGYTKMLDILNGETPGGCSNPVTAYATFAKSNKKFAALWMPVAKGKTGTDADYAMFSAEDREILRRMEAGKTDEERERDRAAYEAGLPLHDKCRLVKKRMLAEGRSVEEILAAWKELEEKEKVVAV